jgi:long-chain acyl-CoA synthetase
MRNDPGDVEGDFRNDRSSRGHAVNDTSLPRMFFERAARFGARPRYRAKVKQRWTDVSWDDCARAVREIAAGLSTLGVAPGDRVALLAATRPEWIEVDLAILSLGAVTIPIYPSVRAEECAYILWDSGAQIAVVENTPQAEKARKGAAQGVVVDGRLESLDLRRLVVIDSVEGEGAVAGEASMTLADLRARGRAEFDRLGPEIERRVAALSRRDLATIVYTSGTTGMPKGVVQTHGNHLASLEAAAQLGLVGEGDVDFLFLPLAHSFARLLEYLGIYVGTITAFAQSIDTVASDMADTRPTCVPAVPRIFEKIHGRILSTRSASNIAKRALFDAALAVGRRCSAYTQAGTPVPAPLEALRMLAHRLVFHRIHHLLGGNVRTLVSGGAPLSPQIAEFFHAVGLLVLEGYGLTETTPIVSANSPKAFKFGTVGRPIPGVELQIAADGEILVRGPNVALGYHRRPDDTALAWDDAGWFRTGDIGTVDVDGFLRITDRKKDLIKTSGGKYVAPQKIENALKSQPHVSQAVVIGDGRKYCVALVTLDVDAVRGWAATHTRALGADEDPSQRPEVSALVAAEVEEVNRELASYESIKYFRIVPQDFTVDAGELTPSLKVKRKVVAERYRALIDAMYAQ